MDENQKGCSTGDCGRGWVAPQESGVRLGQREELPLGEKLFRYAFDRAPTGMALWAPDGTFVRTSHAFDGMMGYKAGEPIGLHCASVILPEDFGQKEVGYAIDRDRGTKVVFWEAVRTQGRSSHLG